MRKTNRIPLTNLDGPSKWFLMIQKYIIFLLILFIVVVVMVEQQTTTKHRTKANLIQIMVKNSIWNIHTKNNDDAWWFFGYKLWRK